MLEAQAHTMGNGHHGIPQAALEQEALKQQLAGASLNGHCHSSSHVAVTAIHVDARPAATVPEARIEGETHSALGSTLEVLHQRLLATSDKESSQTLAVSVNCPETMRRAVWQLSDFPSSSRVCDSDFSELHHAVDVASGTHVALKKYNRAKLPPDQLRQVAREIALHTELSHPSVIRAYAAWSEGPHVCLALEWAPGGDLRDFCALQKRPVRGIMMSGVMAEDAVVAMVLGPLLRVLAHLHAQGVIHRDLKAENILLDAHNAIKLCDFQLAINSTLETANLQLGTLECTAPEVLKCPLANEDYAAGHPHDPAVGYTTAVDVWSLGVLTYELLTGQRPFAAVDPEDVMALIREGLEVVEFPYYVSKDARAFISSTLHQDPAARPMVSQLLSHAWVLKHLPAEPTPV